MEHEDRIKHLQGRIQEQDIAGALLFYSRDIFYYTGTAQPAYLAVLPESYFLFIRSGFEFASNEVLIEKDKVKEERWLENIQKELLSKLTGKNNKIATELDLLPAKQFLEFKKIFPGYDFVDVSPFVLEQRKKKNASEINRIKEACKTIDMGHKAVLSTLKDGISELELASAVENAHRLAGHEGIFFFRQPDIFMSRGIVSSGPNLLRNSGVVYSITGVGLSLSVPAGPSRRVIEKGDLVIVDVPVLVDGYHADQTRTYIVGKASEEIKSMYNSLKEIADYLIQNIKTGMKCSEIYQMAEAKAKELNSVDYFQNLGGGKKVHLIGHGVGIELNEPPIISDYDHSEILDGHVIALDMHIMNENVGAAKLEDTILISHQGNEILTRSPRQLFEI